MATQVDIEEHYDVDNDFFALFLDKQYRVYTCAVWDKAQNLEQAQVEKFNRLCSYANIKAGDKIVDVGCGWGGIMNFISDNYLNAQIHGLTISTKQYNYVKSIKNPNVSVDLHPWQNYSPLEKKFDAIISVCAFEHFASFEDYAANRHRDIYKNFFDWCLGVSTQDAYIALQCIVITRPPNNLTELNDSKYLQKVFPGSALPTISDIQAAIVDKYEISAANRICLHYVRTLAEWKRRLQNNESTCIERYGQELYDFYIGYFDAASRCFESGYWDLYQVSLKRAKSVRVLAD
jgi:cyclopropane-fatty-acyl-phospholipid synthase